MLASRPVDSVESSDSWNAAEEVSAAAQGSGELAGLPLRLLVPGQWSQFWQTQIGPPDKPTGGPYFPPTFKPFWAGLALLAG